MKRNLTLSLDERLLHMARIVCQKRNTTLTQFVRDQLEEMVHHEQEYQNSMKRVKIGTGELCPTTPGGSPVSPSLKPSQELSGIVQFLLRSSGCGV